MPDQVYFRTIAANVELCRTEAEIADEAGNTIAVLFEDFEGWKIQLIGPEADQTSEQFEAAATNAREALGHYVNRQGQYATQAATVGMLALWLMEKDDGTAMGQRIKSAE
jgi:hypothetical protein